MPPKPGSNVISDALAAPLGDLIAAVGRGLAEAQESLDLGTAETQKRLYDGNDQNMELLRRLGYQPTWYRIPELDAQINVSLSIGNTTTQSGQGTVALGGAATPGIRLYVSPLDANYTNRYDYDLQAASLIKFRIIPVPPSTQAAEMKVVPRLERVPWKDASRRLAQLGIPFELPTPAPRDDELLLGSDPGPGELLAPDQKLTLSFDRRG